MPSPPMCPADPPPLAGRRFPPPTWSGPLIVPTMWLGTSVSVRIAAQRAHDALAALRAIEPRAWTGAGASAFRVARDGAAARLAGTPSLVEAAADALLRHEEALDAARQGLLGVPLGGPG